VAAGKLALISDSSITSKNMLVKLLELKICHSSAMQSFCGRKAVLEINWRTILDYK
jgi:hypothetical protein